MKEHRFYITVKSSGSRKSAELAVLAAFSLRKPDGCEFHLRKLDSQKEAWMAGAKAGTQIACDLIEKQVDSMLAFIRCSKEAK